eukprot:UN07549
MDLLDTLNVLVKPTKHLFNLINAIHFFDLIMYLNYDNFS